MTYASEARLDCSAAQTQEFPTAILLAYEEPLARAALAAVLRSAGFFVWELASFPDTQQILREVRFDLVFIDLLGLGPRELGDIAIIQGSSPQARYLVADGFVRRAMHRVSKLLMQAVLTGDRLDPGILLRTVCQSHEPDTNY